MASKAKYYTWYELIYVCIYTVYVYMYVYFFRPLVYVYAYFSLLFSHKM